jgi:hypothetical protein
MEYRSFGRTGVKVSPLCLGAMMFGAWGEREHDKSTRIIHAALPPHLHRTCERRGTFSGQVFGSMSAPRGGRVLRGIPGPQGVQ